MKVGMKFLRTISEGMDCHNESGNSGKDEEPNLGYKPRHKEGYCSVPPTDTFEDIRTKMVRVMQKCGIHIEAQHHEVATGGQGEIDMRFAPLVEQALTGL